MKASWKMLIGLTIGGMNLAHSDFLPEPNLKRAYQTVQLAIQTGELKLPDENFQIAERWTGLPGDGAFEMLLGVKILQDLKRASRLLKSNLSGEAVNLKVLREMDKYRHSHFIEVMLVRQDLPPVQALRDSLAVQLNSRYKVVSIKRRQLVTNEQKGDYFLDTLGIAPVYQHPHGYDYLSSRSLNPASQQKRISVFVKRLNQRLETYDWVNISKSIFADYGFKGNNSYIIDLSVMYNLRLNCHILPSLKYKIDFVEQGRFEFDDPYDGKRFQLNSQLVGLNFYRPGKDEEIADMLLIDYQGGYRIIDFYIIDDEAGDFFQTAF